MRTSKGVVVVSLWGAAWMMAGCRSATAPEMPIAEPSLASASALSPESLARAEALAFYSQGLIHEYNDEFDSAFSNFEKAVRLDPDNEDLALRMAMGLLHQKRNQEAIDLIESLLNRKPESKKALLWLALIYRATNQGDKVQETYKRLIKVAPTDAAGYVELAALYTAQGNYDLAIQVLERAGSKVAKPDEALRALGAVYLQRSMTEPQGGEDRKSRDAAIAIFEKLNRETPGDVVLLYQLGDLYILNQQVEKAIECFEEIEKKTPDNLQVKQKLALSFVAIGNKQKAVEMLEHIAAKRPENPRVFYYLGELYQEMGDKSRAKLNFEFAAKAGPADPAPFLKLALLHLDGEPAKAMACLKEGLVQIPQDPRLTEMLAYVYLSQKQYSKAAGSFDRAIRFFKEKSPDEIAPNLYFNYAVACMKLGKTAKAAQLLAQAIDQNAASVEAFTQFALKQPRGEDQKLAIEILEKVSELQPSNARVLIHLGALHSGLQSYKEAIRAFEKAEPLLNGSPADEADIAPFFYFWFGAASEREGQYDKAELRFRKSIELEPDNPEAYNYLAYMWAEKGQNLETALEFVRKAIELNPESGAFIDTLGWIYYMQGRYPEALDQINKALALIPDDPTISDHLGDILIELDRTGEAVEAWKKAYLLDPENSKLAEKLRGRGVELGPLQKQAQERKDKAARESDGSKDLLKPNLEEPPLPISVLEPDDLETPPSETPAPIPQE